MWENGLLRNLKLISKFMMSQTGKQTMTTNTLPEISKCKCNHKMKLGQLIYDKCGM